MHALSRKTIEPRIPQCRRGGGGGTASYCRRHYVRPHSSHARVRFSSMKIPGFTAEHKQGETILLLPRLSVLTILRTYVPTMKLHLQDIPAEIMLGHTSSGAGRTAPDPGRHPERGGGDSRWVVPVLDLCRGTGTRSDKKKNAADRGDRQNTRYDGEETENGLTENKKTPQI